MGAPPPLLRAWLAMGAGVAGCAVPDPDLDTLHVLTILPVAAIPPARRAALAALAVDLSPAAP
jgi:L-ornithine Nalpha-acyltransferase